MVTSRYEIEKYTSGLIYSSPQELMNYCRNLCRWNPYLTVKWMENVRGRIWSPVEVEMYNKVAKYINNTWDFISRLRYYDEREFWTVRDNKSLNLTDYSMKPTRIPLLNGENLEEVSI